MTARLQAPLGPVAALAAVIDVVARATAGDTAAGITRLSPALVGSAGARKLLRGQLVNPLMRSGRIAEAEAVMAIVVAAHVITDDVGSANVITAAEVAGDRLLHSALLLRLGKHDAALTILVDLAAIDPGDPAVAQLLLQALTTADRASEAAIVAKGWRGWRCIDVRLGQRALLALSRAEDREERVSLGRALLDAATLTPAAAAMVTTAALMALAPADVVALARRVIDAGIEHPGVRIDLATALVACRDRPGAIRELEAAATLAPQNCRIRAALAELLLVAGRKAEALIHADAGIAIAPNLVNLRLLRARALKQLRDFAGAADAMMDISAGAGGDAWHRQTAAALNLAGRPGDAQAVHSRAIARRASRLPTDFVGGLAGLWDRLGEVKVSTARLEWAWGLRDRAIEYDRQEWERRARWGWLADRQIFDWLECRSNETEAVMYHLTDLSVLANFFDSVRKPGTGLVISTAHLGPLFAGPLALDLIDMPSKWLGSAASIPSQTNTRSLISTSDQTAAQVTRRAIQTVEAGYALSIAVDGVMSMAAPRLIFEGQEITYSSFAARLAFRQRVPSVFVCPQWRADRVHFHTNEMPNPDHDEDIESFAERWRRAWLDQIRQCLASAPENLRLSGGLWRHIR